MYDADFIFKPLNTGKSRKVALEEDAMTTTDKTEEIELVACEICLKEVPVSDAEVPETMDYVVHFCGLECYELWKNKPADSEDQDK